MEKTTEQLQKLGFTEYEARAYVALLPRHPLNGYELAKASGIPRANVYSVLEKLEERGAVIRVNTPAGVRYSPVPPSELIQNLGTRFKGVLETAQTSLDQLATPAEHEYVWNARGYAVMLDNASALLEQAKERVLVAVWPQEAEALADRFTQAQARGIDLVTLCLNNCQNECGHCRGHLYRYAVLPPQSSRWLILVPDGEAVLASEIGPGEEVLTVRTRQKLLVNVASRYIRHSIALAAVLNDLGPRLDALLAPGTRSILETIGPDAHTHGWLEEMRLLLSQEPQPSDPVESGTRDSGN